MTYSLTYFNGRGLGESIRLLFKYGEIDFEDIRLEQKDWPEIKEATPFGQVPLLKFNGKQINQSIAISRYVGHIVKLGGNTDWEDLEINAIVDTINDLHLKAMAVFFEPDEEKKKLIQAKNRNEYFPYYFERLNAVVEKNNGYLALGRLTWADIFFIAIVDSIEVCTKETNILDNYPNLKKLVDTVVDIPNIKKWIEERPKTEW